MEEVSQRPGRATKEGYKIHPVGRVT